MDGRVSVAFVAWTECADLETAPMPPSGALEGVDKVLQGIVFCSAPIRDPDERTEDDPSKSRESVIALVAYQDRRALRLSLPFLGPQAKAQSALCLVLERSDPPKSPSKLWNTNDGECTFHRHSRCPRVQPRRLDLWTG